MISSHLYVLGENTTEAVDTPERALKEGSQYGTVESMEAAEQEQRRIDRFWGLDFEVSMLFASEQL